MVLANDFARQWREIAADAHAALEDVGASGWYVLGESVKRFESALAALWGHSHAIGVASGLDAIEISLRIAGCGPGDRVLTTPVSAFATTLAILKIGAIPVFVDTDKQGLLDLDACALVLQQRPEIRFLVPVHLYGRALYPDALARIRDAFPVQIIEDCAQSISATRDGAMTGHAGSLAATSFYPTKNLGAIGDAGAILTNNAEFAERARTLRDYGQTARYRHETIGYNSRLDELQAALLHRAFLPRLERWTNRRRAIARRYLDRIQNAKVHLFDVPNGADPCWHLFPVLVPAERRVDFILHLKNAGVAASIHYPVAIPDQPALRLAQFEMADPCVRARALCSSEVSLPIHPCLHDDEVDQVIVAVNEWAT